MVLLSTVQGAQVTQRFGPSALRVEPSMYSTGDKAYWLPYFGASYFEDFHPGIDRSAPTGTQVLAMEAGTVTFAGWKDSVSGNQVEVEIRPGTRFSVNHLSVVRCRAGQIVGKADVIGSVGSSGATTGPHTHEGVSIREKDSNGVYRTFLYNPALFQVGGRYADDPRVKPETRYMRVNGPGINIRKNDADLFDFASVYAVTRADGIYRGGKRIAPLGKRFSFIRWRDDEGGRWAVVGGFGRALAIHKTLCHFL